jgi:hypothetical protein
MTRRSITRSSACSIRSMRAVDTKGRGMRVTLKDKTGNVLSDLILGKEVDGKMDVRYVRVPDKRHVYTCKLSGELSTKFSDWIETDLLKAHRRGTPRRSSSTTTRSTSSAGSVVPGDKYVVTKDSTSKWTLEGFDPDQGGVERGAHREIADTLGQIKIVGVRRKPGGLTADFRSRRRPAAQSDPHEPRWREGLLPRARRREQQRGRAARRYQKGVHLHAALWRDRVRRRRRAHRRHHRPRRQSPRPVRPARSRRPRTTAT